jgi:Spy/CpxP family protein refolding chaperone
MTVQNEVLPETPARRRFRLAPMLMLGALVAGGAAFFSVNHASADRGPGFEHHGMSDRGPGGHGDNGPGGMMGMMAGRHLDRMLDRVDATDEQRAKIRDISRAARNDIEKLTDVIRPLRKSAMDQMAAPSIDRAAVEGIRSRLSAVTDEISKRITTAMLDVATVLTPEQRAKIAAEMSSRRHGPPPAK